MCYSGVFFHPTYSYPMKTHPTLQSLQKHLPNFAAIDLTAVPALLDTLIETSTNTLSHILANTPLFTWENLMVPLEKMADDIERVWAPLRHLHGTKNTTPLRSVYATCVEALTAYETALGQNQKLYHAIQSLAASSDYQKLTAPQKKVIQDHLRDFRLSGVHLPDGKRNRLEEIAQALSKQEHQFSNNVLDATEAWTFNTLEKEVVAGIPSHIQALAQAKAQERNEAGWTFTLDHPIYSAILAYGENRHLRKCIQHAYGSRASDTGPHGGQWDNSPIIRDILTLRHEEATLLEYSDYCHYSLVTKMAESPKEVLSFLETLAATVKPHALQELAEVTRYAQSKDGIEKLEPWDLPYYSEQLKQQQFHINEQMLREYFPLSHVLKGLFSLLKQLFDVHFEEETVSTWDPTVQFFTLYNARKEKIGHIYCDFFARTGKRGGAWMDECRQRHYLPNGQLELPVAFLTCNFAAPTEGKPSCLDHDDVVTLFHEMGHCLHHLLTTINYSDVSGINGVPWDAVEFPSQLLEQWCWQPEVLSFLSAHVDSQTSLPQPLIEKLVASRYFQIGLRTLRQVLLGIFDLTVHSETFAKSTTDVVTLYRDLHKQYGVTPLTAEYRLPHSFSHIFAGGYAAGYYSYQWAEVMAWDAFDLFREKGCLDKATGQKLRDCVLAKGGAYEFMDLFIAFRGRPPAPEALLRHAGLAP